MKKIIRFLAVIGLCMTTAWAAENDAINETEVVEENEIAAEDAPTAPLELIDEEKIIAAVDNLGPTASGFQSDNDTGPDDEDKVDPKVLRDFIESKGLISCRQKEGLLTIAGDVRARWIASGETLNGIKQRGQGTKVAINRFKSEVNLYLDYVAPRTWVATKLTFVNFDGRDGGTATKVDMERAFIGYDVYERGKEDFYIEIGRSNLDYLFDSKVEFSSIFDGIHLFYTNYWPCVGQFTIHGGPFIVDSFTNHYAWIVEAYVTKWRETGFSFKYSIVDWFRHAPTLNYGNAANAGKILITNNPRYRFVVSQWLVGYEEKIDFLKCKTLFLYGAYLHNWAARPYPQTKHRKLNNAFYIGFTLGKLCKACDWSLDINYQFVQAQAVPEFDLNGIGHGNAANGLLADSIIADAPLSTVRLFTNFQGIQINGLYAMTDALSLRAKAQYSVPADRGIGGNFRFKSFEMSVIYAF